MTDFKINSINICAGWSYSSKNQTCICSRPFHLPTANEVQKKVISRNNVVTGECGHAFHKECINNYIKNNLVNGTQVSLCPIDHLPWTPKQKETICVKPEYYLY